jgi:GT2 family glycosyltransferase
VSNFLKNLPGHRAKGSVRPGFPPEASDQKGEGPEESPSGGDAPKLPGISVVIVSYNVREYLDACLQSVYHAAETFPGTVEVIVVDNDSRDGTLTLLKPRYPEATWLKSDRNLGFGTGCNRGAAMSTQDLLLFLNPDTLVAENTFHVMRDFFQARGDQVGVAGCKIVNRDGSLQLACKRSFPSPQVAAFKFVGLSGLFPKSRVFGRYNLTFLDENKTHEVDAVSGSFLCIKSELFRAVGGFDEDFFMYGEDLDICFRVKLLGKRNFYHPETTVMHFKGESAKSRPLRSFLYFYEAMVIFSKKHFELRALPLTVFYLGVIALAFANFAYSRFQKWQRWMSDLTLVNLILAVMTFAYMRYIGVTSLYHTDRRLYFFWHALVSVSVLAPMAYIGDYGRFIQKLRTVFATLCVSFLGFFAMSFFIREEAYSRVAFALAALFSIGSLTAWRFLAIQGGRFFAKIMGSTKRIAIIGEDERAHKLSELIQQERLAGYEFVGFIRLGSGKVSQDVRQNLIGDLHTLGSIIKKVDIQGVVIAVEEGAFQTALKILSEKSNHGIEVKLLVGDPEPGLLSLIDLNFGK